MTDLGQPAWRCTVCGYIHHGDQPPDFCPVCGAARSDFEPYTEAAPSKAAVKPSQWQCLNCNFVHDGPEPPEICPVCGAPAERFEAVQPVVKAGQTSTAPTRLLIIGGGIAGVSAAETARQASPSSQITILSQEPMSPYYRLNLTRYLAGEIERDVLPVHPVGWYEERQIGLLTGREVSGLSPEDKEVHAGQDEVLPFDSLILAMGSHPFVPPFPGTQLEGVVTLRTAADAEHILERLARGGPCVCIGGGILGIETAGALASRNADVTLLESHQWLMPRQLNRKAGARLKDHISGLGVALKENARTRQIAGDEHVGAVVLETGETIPAALVVIATGVRPNTFLARKAGLEVNRGIVVDNFMRTSSPNVYAAGDVAEHNGTIYGAWAASQYQGSIAGLNAVGVPTPFGGLPRSNSLKVLGLDLLSIGQFTAEDGSYLELEREEDGSYSHFVFRDGKLLGCILMGDAVIGPAVKKAIESKADLSGLLLANPTASDVLEHFRQEAASA